MSSSFYLKSKRTLAASTILACLACVPAVASPWAGQLGQDHANLCGKGSFRFFGFSIYEAELFSACPPQVFESPFALRLNYQRSFTRDQLVDSSVQEMQRIGANTIGTEQMQRWRAEMEQAFVNVNSGDSITGVFLPGQGAMFYVNDQLQHTVNDPEFARSFFGIWLHRDTRAPGLRASLLGQTP